MVAVSCQVAMREGWSPVAGYFPSGGAVIGDVLDTGRPMAYTIKLEFEWDDVKNNACFVRRGFDFAYAIRAFFDPHRIVVQDR